MDEGFSDSEVVLEDDVLEVEDVDEDRLPDDGETCSHIYYMYAQYWYAIMYCGMWRYRAGGRHGRYGTGRGGGGGRNGREK